MGVIKILDENLSNMIAAGEVVENPSSLVKELLENSLDANSKYIRIDVKNGGKNITINDDGDGMSKDDLLLCIERHATSKISSKGDLFKLSTYGFRGEALSSIASVSKMILSTKQKNSKIGYVINVLGGKITNLKELQKGNGTQIIIKDLFYNTPARLKFLRRDSTENTKIKEIVLQEALINSKISIVLTIDGKESIRTSGKGIENTILELFGISILKNIKKIDSGYIGNTSITRASKDYMFIFVNKRPIKAKIIEQAILDAYYTNLMKGKYPFAIIDLQIDPKTIDVNVHPSKKIVKFSNESDVYTKLFNEIKNAFLMNRELNTQTISLTKSINFDEMKDFNLDSYENKVEIAENNSFFSENTVIKPILPTKSSNFNLFPKHNKNYVKSEKSSEIEIKQNKNDTTKNPSINSTFLNNNLKNRLTIIGQYANTYILVEDNNELIIYDQHIVHERILYEKLKREYYNKKIISQSLLVPISISLSPKEVELFLENKDLFNNFGFEIDEFNDFDFLIRAVPNLKFKDSFENIFFQMLKGLDRLNSKNDVIENMIISMSCRGAIKANEKLTQNEMEKLIYELHCIGKFTCPHGRPITFKIKLLDIEKGFKRK